MSSGSLSQGLQSFDVPGGNFNFTGMPIDNIGSLEQTLYGLIVDESGSTHGFRDEMSKVTQQVVQSLQDSPRADNLMFRLVHFASAYREIHVFKPLQECNVGDYADLFGPSGSTLLFDTTLEMSEAVRIYAENLAAQHYMANGIITVITDGCDYPGSTHGPNDVRKSFEDMVLGENLESLVTILIGVNITNQNVAQALQEFKDQAGFTQYIELDNASAKTLARLADFISQSVSSQSQALGTGGASQSLTF